MADSTRKIIAERNKLLKEVQRLEKLAFLDQLTGLPNRHALLEDLGKLLAQPTKPRNGHGVGLLLLDIDWFKVINDKFNHLTGDRVLRAAAGIVEDSIKESLFRVGDKVYRLGGEEFVVLLPAISKEGMGIVAERIRKNIADNLVRSFPAIRKQGGKITVSIGGSTFTPAFFKKTDSAEKLLAKMIAKPDQYLYRAKESGRNCVIINGEIT